MTERTKKKTSVRNGRSGRARSRSLKPRRGNGAIRNYVHIGVTFPDGCRHTQQMDHECDEAHDAVKFGKFLTELGEEVIERATRLGRCCARNDDEEPR